MYNRCMIEFKCDQVLDPVLLTLRLDASTVDENTTAKHVKAAALVMFRYPNRINVKQIRVVKERK